MVNEIESKPVFDNRVAEKISKTDPKFQYQGQLITTWGMMGGMTAMAIYLWFFSGFAFWMRVLSVVNGFFFILLMYAQLVMTYQQYRSYKEAKDIQDAQKAVFDAVKASEMALDKPKEAEPSTITPPISTENKILNKVNITNERRLKR